jgi:putative transposase
MDGTADRRSLTPKGWQRAGCWTELLNESLFLDLDHTRSRIANWIDDYNQRRPHSALGYLTPVAYAANLSTTRDRLRNPDQLRRSHVAPPPPHGVKLAEALIAFG